jgi:hypothetical protein
MVFIDGVRRIRTWVIQIIHTEGISEEIREGGRRRISE